MIKFLLAISVFILNLNSGIFNPKLDFSSKELPGVSISVDKSSIYTYPLALFSESADISYNIRNAIKNSSKSIDIALYSFTDTEIAREIINAKYRNVKLRVLIDYSHVKTSKVSEAIKMLLDKKVNVRIIKGGGWYGVMHNKFAIFDSKFLITGSYNWTYTANYNNYENIIFIDDENQINSYTEYFELMWEQSLSPYEKTIITNEVPPALLSQINSIRDNVLKLINTARKSIDIAVYSIYDDEIFDALLEAKKRGVKIRIITDKLQATQSEVVKKLYDSGFDLKISRGFNNGMMHNKYAIFDNEVVITGSFNWSNNAEVYNWENLAVVSGPYVKIYSEHFEKLYPQAYYPTYEDLYQKPDEEPQSR